MRAPSTASVGKESGSAAAVEQTAVEEFKAPPPAAAAATHLQARERGRQARSKSKSKGGDATVAKPGK